MSWSWGLRSDRTESLHIRCLQRGSGVTLIRTQYYRSPQPRGCGGARAMRPEQGKRNKRCKGILTVWSRHYIPEDKPCFPVNYRAPVSTAETKCLEPKVGTKCPERMHALPFYRKHDVTQMCYVRTIWAQWREGLWLSESWIRGLSLVFIPSSLLRLENDIRLEPYGSIFLPARRQFGAVVGKKAGSFADARHSPPGC